MKRPARRAHPGTHPPPPIRPKRLRVPAPHPSAGARSPRVGHFRSPWTQGGRGDPAPKQPVAKPTRRSTGDPSRLNHSASLRSALRFGRNTPGIPPSRALSAGRLAPTGRTGRPRRSRGFHHRLLTTSLAEGRSSSGFEPTFHSGTAGREEVTPGSVCIWWRSSP